MKTKALSAAVLLVLVSGLAYWLSSTKARFNVGKLTGDAGDRLVRATYDALASKSSLKLKGLEQLTGKATLFLSVSDGETPAIVTHATANSVTNSLSQAVDNIRKHPAQQRPLKWLKVDIVTRLERLGRLTNLKKFELERSLFGLALGPDFRIAFLPEELVVHALVTSKNQYSKRNVARYLTHEQQSLLRSLYDQEEAIGFPTKAYFFDGKKVHELYRGHRIFNTPKPDQILKALRMATTFLKKSVKPNGEFVYSYLPKADRAGPKYNILRHAGTTYSMLEQHELRPDPELLSKSQAAIDWLKKRIYTCPEPDPNALCVVEKGFTKVGGNGLAIVALAQHAKVTGRKTNVPLMAGLARRLAAVQGEDGRFTRHKQSTIDGRDSGFVSEYYPGEAILALTRLYALDGEKKWLDTADAAATYLITIRDKGLSIRKIAHDHWLLYGLNELYRFRQKPIFLTHARKIVEAILSAQNLKPRYADWYGSFYRPPRSTPAATRVEGLVAAYKLFHRSGDKDFAARILQAIKNSISFQLGTQILAETAMYLPNPVRSLGGFRHSLTNYEVRIDYVQHNISALVGYYRIVTGSSEENPKTK